MDFINMWQVDLAIAVAKTEKASHNGEDKAVDRPLDDTDKQVLTFAYCNLLLLLAPMAPHITEEIWQNLGCAGSEKGLIHVQEWPKYDEKLTIDDRIELVFQVNGKIVSKQIVRRGLEKSKAEALALSDDKVLNKIDKRKVQKIIVVIDRLVNVVI